VIGCCSIIFIRVFTNLIDASLYFVRSSMNGRFKVPEFQWFQDSKKVTELRNYGTIEHVNL
jgi:hypothetical protein